RHGGGKSTAWERRASAPPTAQKPPPPIIVGGQGEKWIVPLVARYADGWNAVTGVGVEGVKSRRKIIADECARIGRSPCPTEVSVLLPLVALTNVPLAGPVVRLGARVVAGAKGARSVLADRPPTAPDRLRGHVGAGAAEDIPG